MMQRIISEIRSRFFTFGIGSFIRRIVKRSLPQNRDGRILIHFGCGTFNDQRFINVDTRRGWHIHYVESIENASSLFPPNFADLIYTCHIIEHISHKQLQKVIQNLFIILKDDGVLRISVPDFDKIIAIYSKCGDIEAINTPLMGAQSYPGNTHKSVFNQSYLQNLLYNCGFNEVRLWKPEEVDEHCFNDWSKRKFYFSGIEFEISLNMEAVK